MDSPKAVRPRTAALLGTTFSWGYVARFPLEPFVLGLKHV
jgi:hypothetical protein